LIIIDIDIATSKTNNIIFEIEIAYVSNLAHPCVVSNIELETRTSLPQKGLFVANSLAYQNNSCAARMIVL
jgi:hypothetical protein